MDVAPFELLNDTELRGTINCLFILLSEERLMTVFLDKSRFDFVLFLSCHDKLWRMTENMNIWLIQRKYPITEILYLSASLSQVCIPVGPFAALLIYVARTSCHFDCKSVNAQGCSNIFLVHSE